MEKAENGSRKTSLEALCGRSGGEHQGVGSGASIETDLLHILEVEWMILAYRLDIRLVR